MPDKELSLSNTFETDRRDEMLYLLWSKAFRDQFSETDEKALFKLNLINPNHHTRAI